MLGITCGKCSRRFTPGTADLQGYLADAEGKKFVQVLCPHCGYGNKVPVTRLQQAVKVPGDNRAQEANKAQGDTEPDTHVATEEE